MLELIDLSNNNGGAINFRAVKQAGTFGVWHKVTEGESFVDKVFAPRAAAARKAGLRVGGYHFARPQPGTARAEAAYFARHLGKIGRRDLRPFLDLEEYPRSMRGEELHLWATTFLAHFHKSTGIRALTYSSPGFVAEQGWTRTFGTGAGLLVADYGNDDGRDHGTTAPHPWHRIAGHQYTSSGTVAGIAGRVDRWHVERARSILARPILGRL